MDAKTSLASSLLISYLVVLCIFIIFIIIYSIFWDYFYHVRVTKEKAKRYDVVNFDTFLKEYEKYKNYGWVNDGYSGSLFIRKGKEEYVYIHAGYIIFEEDKYMMLDPISYLKFQKWIKKETRVYNRKKGLFEDGVG